MSNKTQLQTNNTALDALITRVSAAKDIAASLPEAGSGGGNIETCNIEIKHSGGYPLRIYYTSYENDEYIPKYIYSSSSTLENVVCNSSILVTVETAFTTYGFPSGAIVIKNSINDGRVMQIYSTNSTGGTFSVVPTSSGGYD